MIDWMNEIKCQGEITLKIYQFVKKSKIKVKI